MSLRPDLDLAEFVFSFVQRRGGVIEESPDGLVSALIPPDLSENGVEEMLTLAFEPEVAQEAPHAQVVTFGSPLLERWIEQARREGRSARAWALGVSVHPRKIPSPQTAMAAPDAKEMEITFGPPQAWLVGTLLFTFRICFRSDEREEDLRVIVVDRCQGRIVRQFSERAVGLTLAGDACGLETIPVWAKQVDPLSAYRTAREELAGQLLPDVYRRKEAVRARRERERGKVGRYFEQLETEAAEALQEAREDPEVSRPLLDKLAATRTEKGRHLSQIDAKYALSVEVSLSSVLEVLYPRAIFPCRARGRRGEPVDLALSWDPLLGTWAPPPCPRCVKPTTILSSLSDGKIGCPVCRG